MTWRGRSRPRTGATARFRSATCCGITWRASTGPADALAFGDTSTAPFSPKKLTARADAAWEGAELTRITLHECRHSYASLMIAAGTNAKALSTYMGHANIAITLDKYGHLFPGNEDEAAGLLNAYLVRSIKRLPRTRDAHSARSRSRKPVAA